MTVSIDFYYIITLKLDKCNIFCPLTTEKVYIFTIR